MGGFFGNLIGSIISRLMIMGAVVAGGQYYMSQGGGLSGILGGGSGGSAVTAPPISAGIGGLSAIASTLGIGTAPGPEYFEIKGRISAVGVECRLIRNNANGKQTRTEPLSCDRAQAALAYPQFAGYRLSEARTATYIYYAMDGVKVLTGKAAVRRGQNVGDVIDLRINRDNPKQSTPI